MTMHILAKGSQRKISQKYINSEEQSRGQKIKVEYIFFIERSSSSRSVDGSCIRYWMLLTEESRSTRRETSQSATLFITNSTQIDPGNMKK